MMHLHPIDEKVGGISFTLPDTDGLPLLALKMELSKGMVYVPVAATCHLRFRRGDTAINALVTQYAWDSQRHKAPPASGNFEHLTFLDSGTDKDEIKLYRTTGESLEQVAEAGFYVRRGRTDVQGLLLFPDEVEKVANPVGYPSLMEFFYSRKDECIENGIPLM